MPNNIRMIPRTFAIILLASTRREFCSFMVQITEQVLITHRS